MELCVWLIGIWYNRFNHYMFNQVFHIILVVLCLFPGLFITYFIVDFYKDECKVGVIRYNFVWLQCSALVPFVDHPEKMDSWVGFVRTPLAGIQSWAHVILTWYANHYTHHWGLIFQRTSSLISICYIVLFMWVFIMLKFPHLNLKKWNHPFSLKYIRVKMT